MNNDVNYPLAIDPQGHALWEFNEAIERIFKAVANDLRLPYKEIMKTWYETQKEGTEK